MKSEDYRDIFSKDQEIIFMTDFDLGEWNQSCFYKELFNWTINWSTLKVPEPSTKVSWQQAYHSQRHLVSGQPVTCPLIPSF